MNYKFIKSEFKEPCDVTIITETGHEIKFTLIPRTYIDVDKNEEVFFFCEFHGEYLGTLEKNKFQSLDKIKDMLDVRAIDNYWKAREYDTSHI